MHPPTNHLRCASANGPIVKGHTDIVLPLISTALVFQDDPRMKDVFGLNHRHLNQDRQLGSDDLHVFGQCGTWLGKVVPHREIQGP